MQHYWKSLHRTYCTVRTASKRPGGTEMFTFWAAESHLVPRASSWALPEGQGGARQAVPVAPGSPSPGTGDGSSPCWLTQDGLRRPHFLSDQDVVEPLTCRTASLATHIFSAHWNSDLYLGARVPSMRGLHWNLWVFRGRDRRKNGCTGEFLSHPNPPSSERLTQQGEGERPRTGSLISLLSSALPGFTWAGPTQAASRGGIKVPCWWRGTSSAPLGTLIQEQGG